jgi:hypothetical protein
MKVQRQEIAATGRRTARLEGALRDRRIGHVRRIPVQAAQAGHVGDGLDVEDERRGHAAAGREAADSISEGPKSAYRLQGQT